jgi:hypothetical protein
MVAHSILPSQYTLGWGGNVWTSSVKVKRCTGR